MWSNFEGKGTTGVSDQTLAEKELIEYSVIKLLGDGVYQARIML